MNWKNDISLSSINKEIEDQRILDSYKRSIREFISKYDTDNFVIGYGGSEIVEGYLKVYNRYKDLNEALKSLKLGDLFYIKNREGESREYLVGRYYNSIPDEDEVISIKNFNEL